ncbi:MAG TPA: GTA-gp10 family protein [Microvirga sp.]|nr:GTA-gp10 family protein [Microvirga sp.]
MSRKLHYVMSTFGGEPAMFCLTRRRLEIFEVGLEAGSAFEFLRRLLNGTWATRDLVSLLQDAYREHDGNVNLKAHSHVRAVIEKNGPGHYVGLAAKIIEAALFGIPEKDAVFDEAKQLTGEAG